MKIRKGWKMKPKIEETEKIRNLLQKSSKGMTITEISTSLAMHRNTTAKYLDMLVVTGEIDRKRMGPAKVYFPSRRVPVQALPLVTPPTCLCLTSRLEVTEATPEAVQLLNLPGETKYTPYTAVPTPLFRDEAFLTKCHNAVAGTPGEYHTAITQNRQKTDLAIRFIPIVFTSGTTGCAVTFINITGKAAAEKELNTWKERYTALSEDVTEWVVSTSPAMTIEYANEAFCRHVGRPANHMPGIRFMPAFRPDERRHLDSLVASLQPAGSPVREDIHAIRRDGSPGWETWTIRAIGEVGGPITGYHATGHDITALKHYEEQVLQYHQNLEENIHKRTAEMQQANQALMTVLAEKEDLEQELLFTRQAFDQASDSILLFSRDGSICQTNRTAEELMGYSREELAECTIYDVNPSITQEKWDTMWNKPEPGRKERTISVHRRRDGTIFDVDLSRTFVKADEEMYFCSIAREIKSK
ncbi:PAS domain-containing protein [Methanogenium marinum]|uniref:PAS domain-containing protein n=1 Tax=Methanogenium marinum TaxID=348610 RepID=A0A9Q4PVJ2_9EURY|nr:PAS domain-containing protein [Methanogenium marinum]MDE4908080.1 PAS domain-containing protein [Methanogenium marinum]